MLHAENDFRQQSQSRSYGQVEMYYKFTLSEITEARTKLGSNHRGQILSDQTKLTNLEIHVGQIINSKRTFHTINKISLRLGKITNLKTAIGTCKENKKINVKLKWEIKNLLHRLFPMG